MASIAFPKGGCVVEPVTPAPLTPQREAKIKLRLAKAKTNLVLPYFSYPCPPPLLYPCPTPHFISLSQFLIYMSSTTILSLSYPMHVSYPCSSLLLTALSSTTILSLSYPMHISSPCSSLLGFQSLSQKRKQTFLTREVLFLPCRRGI